MKNNSLYSFWKRQSVEQKTVLLALVVIGILFAILFIPIFAVSDEDNTEKLVVAHKIQKPEAFENISIQAKSAYVWDIETGRVLFEKNADMIYPLASLTKLMSAYVAIDSGVDPKIIITPEALFEEGEYGFYAFQNWESRDLLDFSLLESSNDGIKAVASASLAGKSGKSFVETMNAYARTLGLKETTFQNETGLDIKDVSNGGYSNAREVSILLKHILSSRPDILEATKENDLRLYAGGLLYDAENTNPYTGEVPGLLASKTGFTDLSGGNLAIVFDAGLNRPIIITVLGSSYDGRFTDVLKLVKASSEYISQE